MGKFVLWQSKGKKKEWRWNLKARNGQVIAVSEGYTTEESARNGIRSVRVNAPFGKIVKK